MSLSSRLVDCALLEQLIPINSLSAANLTDLASKMSIEYVPAGGTLFSVGDRDNRSVYLIAGEVELRKEREQPQRLHAGSREARHPVVPLQPRPCSAVAVGDVEVMRVDNRLLDMMLTWDQSAGYVVTELTAGEDSCDPSDWMSRMLQSSIFFQVPPANIQELFKRMESISLAAGGSVIRQGEPGDYYYVISRGKALVTRTSPTGSEIRLAELGPGDSFGEEALICDEPRNASVSMISDGSLMRLSKPDFDELLKGPVLCEVSLDEGRAMAADGAVWLDVRLESEHANAALPDSLNVPLCLLRLRARELDPERTYIAYCDSGQRSAAAAYLLSEAGLDVCVLAGGYREAAQ
ncbi:MAG: cyclic nucleotide-binding domain-containing protein [Thiogranum sp.]|nr:cyclic nucleotide-binding domain-containing protein [Thiogranum sp.]